MPPRRRRKASKGSAGGRSTEVSKDPGGAPPRSGSPSLIGRILGSASSSAHNSVGALAPGSPWQQDTEKLRQSRLSSSVETAVKPDSNVSDLNNDIGLSRRDSDVVNAVRHPVVHVSASVRASPPAISPGLTEGKAPKPSPSLPPSSAPHHQQAGKGFHPTSWRSHPESRGTLLKGHDIHQADLRGLMNLSLIVLVATNFREVMVNLMKYGIRIQLLFGGTAMIRDNVVLLTGTAIELTIAIVAYLLEANRAKWFAKEPSLVQSRSSGGDSRQSESPLVSEGNGQQRRSSRLLDQALDDRVIEIAKESAHVLLVTLNAGLMMVLPYLLVTYTAIEPVASLAVLMISVTWALKLASFHHVLHDIRVIYLTGESFESICRTPADIVDCNGYPSNLSLKDFALFIAYPTLCFQLSYPRADRIEWKSVGRCVITIIMCLVAIKIIIEQYMAVIVENAFTVVYHEDLSLPRFLVHILERTLKLSLPTLYSWLLMFLAFFHAWLLLLAQITRFGDQRFYDDWWNAAGFGEYWRKWNLPVHQFCGRHIYMPLVKRRVPKFIAGQVVFLASALAHEYLVVAPLKLGWTGLVFMAFVCQTPLMLITDPFISKRNPTMGNVIFWIVFCFTGQPLAVMVFYYLFNVKQGIFSSLAPDTASLFK